MAISMTISKIWMRAFLRKPRAICIEEETESKLQRTLSLFDLLCIGIGGTVGSGVFVLTGLIAHDYAGPGVVWSWAIAGFACTFSAMSYAEMSSRIPSAGSSYAYVYVALGELPAVVAAWCLTLEYGLSGSAVARSWGEKVVSWTDTIGVTIWSPLDPGSGVNIFAGGMMMSCVCLLLGGVEMGKETINVFTGLKLLLVSFMIFAGFALFKSENLTPMAPKGISGILRGATSSFFGYLGYDEVCCLAVEAKDPQRTLPLAVFGTIGVVTVLYCLASLALVGMLPYDQIDTDSGFSDAFKDRGQRWAQQLVAVGEIVTLPLVVLISFLAQPRLMYAMAEDGLIPKLFGEVNSSGNLSKGILVSGAVCTLVALFVPFTYLDDMISAGVLLSFNLTNSSLIVVRMAPIARPSTCKLLIFLFNAMAFIASLLLAYIDLSTPLVIFPVLVVIACLVVIHLLVKWFPLLDDGLAHKQYRVPYMPYPPLFGIFVNYFLVAQLEWFGILLIFGYIGLAVVFYFVYGIHHSRGNNGGWVETIRKSILSGDMEGSLNNEDMRDSLIKKYGNSGADEVITSSM